METTGSAEVIVLGATCMDVKVRPLAPEVLGSFNPARISVSAGGSARNISENLALLGVRVTLLSVVGSDILGQELLRRTAASGVDVSRVLRSRRFDSGINVTVIGRDSQRIQAMDDWSQIQSAPPSYLRKNRDLFQGARLLILDGTADTETVAEALAVAREAGVPVCADPAAVRRATALRPFLSEFRVVTPNRLEAEVMLDVEIEGTEDALQAARTMVSMGVELAVITLGEAGLVYVSSEGTTESRGHIPAIRCDVVDRTGVGDAQTAAIVYGLVNDMPADECLRLGIAATTMTLGCPQSVCPHMSLDQLYSNMVI